MTTPTVSRRLVFNETRVDLQTRCKQAHRNVKGPQFIALHKLFDEVNEAVEEYVDLIAERVVQLGGVAEGTARVLAQRSTLLDYPLTLTTGEEHMAALSEVLAQFGRSARMGIAEMDELEDAGSTDLLTEVSRGVDKWLWFLEAHQQGAPSETVAEAPAPSGPVSRAPTPGAPAPRASEDGASRRATQKVARRDGRATTGRRGKR